MKEIIRKTAIFLEMIKFEHSLFALPFAYLGYLLALKGQFDLRVFLWVTVAMVSFRTYGMGLNRIIDRYIDAENPRTEKRAIPAGLIKVSFVWGVTVLSLVIFEVSAFLLQPVCFQLSWIPVALALLYPWMKRFSWLSHFILGMILGIAPYGAWLAAGAPFSLVPLFLTAGVTSWVAGFDIIYALQDREFDLRRNLYSYPAKFGSEASMRIVCLLHVFACVFWLMAGVTAKLGIFYYIGLTAAGFYLARENWMVRKYGLEKVQDAFFKMNISVSMGLFLAVLIDTAVRNL